MTIKNLNNLIAIALFFAVAAFLLLLSPRVNPQYSLDAAYYHVMTDQLEKGKGFTEPVIWHHLKQYTEIERPMDYWMPLGILLFRLARYVAGEGREIWINIVLWSLLAVLVFQEVFKHTSCRSTALTASLTMIFCGRFLFYILTTDNFVFYALLGFCYFKLLESTVEESLMLPVVAGLIALMRIEGLIFAALAGFFYFLRNRRPVGLLIFILLFLITVFPWIYRNIATFGVLWNSNSKALFLTKYDDFFTGEFAGSLSGFLEQGFHAIFRQRLNGLANSFLNLVVLPGQFVFFPLWLAGLVIGWNRTGKVFTLVLSAFVMLCGILFTHQSARGTALHISAFFAAHFSILLGLGLHQVKLNYLTGRKGYALMVLVMLWSAIFSGFSMKALIEHYERDLAPYEALFKQYQPQGEDRVVSVSPIFVKNISGAGGVISIATDSARLIAAADLYRCSHILVDTRIGQKPIESQPEWVQIASVSELILYKRKRDLSAR